MMKKLVILSAFLTPFRSGAEACAEEVAGQLNDQYDITIITARLRKDLPYLDRLNNGVKVWRVGFGRPIDKWLFPFLAPRAVCAPKPDTVHAALETFAGLALKFYRGPAKHILTLQTTNRTFMKGSIIRAAGTVTAISSTLVGIAKDYCKDAILIPNGIRLHDLQEAMKKHPKVAGRILFVGRLEQMKGIDTLLTAFARLCAMGLPTGQAGYEQREARSLKLRIVGDGSQRSYLESLAKKLGIQGRVTFVGRIAPEHIAKEFAEAEIFCGLSRSEALGNVFIEAQAAGCAVVATNVGGIPDSVEDGVTGLLVPPDNVDAAVKALQRLIDDTDLRHTLASAGMKNAERYDWSAIAKKYATIYDQ
jgi:glycosyltransferase involved in cell wall biosynthesis